MQHISKGIVPAEPETPESIKRKGKIYRAALEAIEKGDYSKAEELLKPLTEKEAIASRVLIGISYYRTCKDKMLRDIAICNTIGSLKNYLSGLLIEYKNLGGV